MQHVPDTGGSETGAPLVNNTATMVAPIVAKVRREAPAASRKAGAPKTNLVLKKLRSAKGATLQQLSDATDWQLHSVRGFLSAVVRKKLGLNLTSEVGKDAIRRYRVTEKPADGATS